MKKWCIQTISIFAILVIFFVSFMYIVDPFFHYHKSYFHYDLSSERYQNYGIVKNFEYDSIITGTSMIENFKTSEFETLFDSKLGAIKIPFAGNAYREPNDCLIEAFKSNNNIKYVLRSMDISSLISEYNVRNTKMDIPDYLYDKNYLNDINYVLNKEVFLNYALINVKKTLFKNDNTTFDEYSYWGNQFPFSKDYVLQHYERQNEVVDNLNYDKVKKMVEKNIEKNIVSIAKNNPKCTFYIFIPPYSILFWDTINNQQILDYYIYAQELALSMIVKQPNIKLYGFGDIEEIVTNLDNYKDSNHYSPSISSQILKWISEDFGLITQDNYKDYIKSIEELYTNYDYDSIFK